MHFVDNKQWHYKMPISAVTFLRHNFFKTCFIAATTFLFIRSLTTRNR